MNIVHCFFTMETGGSQILAVDLLNEMCEKHNTSLIIVNNKFNKKLLAKLKSKVKVYYLNRIEGSKNPIPILKLNWILYKLQPDVIHCHEPKMATAIKVKKPKLLYTIHDVGIKTTYFGLYDALVAISDAVEADIAAQADFNIQTIYNGIANQLFKQRTDYKLGKDEPVKLVQISRLVHEKKGQDILILALEKVKKEYKYSGFMMDFIGGGESLDYLKNLVATHGLEDNIRFLGEQDRDWIYNNLCNYHVLVQPSRYEGFGLTLIEGFAAGLLVLASDIDGPVEIISKTDRGFVFKTEDIDDCAKALNNLFNLYTNDKAGVLIKNAPNLAETVYSIKTCSDKYLTEYAL